MGLNIDYFYSLTQRQFANIANGYFKKQDYLSRERWVIARKLMHSALMPHMKNSVKETDLLSFPWEEKMLAEFTIEEAQKLEEEVERIKNFYDSWDNKQVKA